MRSVVVVFVLLQLAAAPAERETWHGRALVVRGKLAAVYVEPVLYRRADRKTSFFTAIWIRNLTDRPLAIDGPGEHWFVHPNQWVATDVPRRDVIDEETLVPQPRMRSTNLVTIAAGASLVTYAEFDGSAPADLAKVRERYVLLTFDGQLFVSDGTTVEDLEAKAGDITAADLALATPVAWKDLDLDDGLAHRR